MGSLASSTLGTGLSLIYLLGSAWSPQAWLRTDRCSLSASCTCQFWQDMSLGVWVRGGNSGSGRDGWA